MQFPSLPSDTTTPGAVANVAVLAAPLQATDPVISGAVAPAVFADVLAGLGLPSVPPALAGDQAPTIQENAVSWPAALPAHVMTGSEPLVSGIPAASIEGGSSDVASGAPDIPTNQSGVPWNTVGGIAAAVTSAESVDGKAPEPGTNDEPRRPPAGDPALMMPINAALAYGVSAMPLPVALPPPIPSVADADETSAAGDSCAVPAVEPRLGPAVEQWQPLPQSRSVSAVGITQDARAESVSSPSTTAAAFPGVSTTSGGSPGQPDSFAPVAQASTPAEPPNFGDIPRGDPELRSTDVRSYLSSVCAAVGAESGIPSVVQSAIAPHAVMPPVRVAASALPAVGVKLPAGAVSTPPPPSTPMPREMAATEEPIVGASLLPAHPARSTGIEGPASTAVPAATPAPQPWGVPVAAATTPQPRRDAPATEVAVVEKFAAAEGGAPLDGKSGEVDAVKPMVRSASKELSKPAPVLGTATAQLPATMPAGSTSARSNAVHVNAVDLGAAVRNDAAVTTAQVALPSAVHQAVEAVLTATDRLAQAPQHAVNLRFEIGGSDLNVRVALRGETVHTTFRTDSAELRSALSTEWQAVAASSAGDRPVRLAAPVFASNDQGGAPFTGDSTPHHQEQSPRGSEPPLPPFRGSASPRGHVQAASAPTLPAVRPVSANSIHLHTLA